MSNMKSDHNNDDAFTKEYTNNNENMWTDSCLKDCLGFQFSAWWLQTSSKNKVNRAENGMKLEVPVELWQQTNIFRD